MQALGLYPSHTRVIYLQHMSVAERANLFWPDGLAVDGMMNVVKDMGQMQNFGLLA